MLSFGNTSTSIEAAAVFAFLSDITDITNTLRATIRNDTFTIFAEIRTLRVLTVVAGVKFGTFTF